MANINTTSTQFPMNILVFKGKNYERCDAEMNVIFIFQYVVEIVNDGVDALEENANECSTSCAQGTEKER